MKTHPETLIRRSGFTTRLGTLGAGVGAILVAFLSACDGGGSVQDAGSDESPDASAVHAGADGSASQLADGAVALLPTTQSCTAAAQCASGFCVDGVCCASACGGSCQSCGLTGKVGTCSPVKNADDDDTCGGESTCDPSGSCRRTLGKACARPSDCASDNCVDGVCCGSATCGTCQSCAVDGSLGTCAPVAKLTETAGCSGASACNGLGECHSKNGQTCSGAADCVSGFCADQVCCATACDGTCYSCNQAETEGTCKAFSDGEDLEAKETCSGTHYCGVPAGAAPACTSKLNDWSPCTYDVQCLGGSCQVLYVDGDGDGYGGAPLRVCLSPKAIVRAGFTSVGGDCCDLDAGAHPGETPYSALPDACGSFDWNCDRFIDWMGSSPTATCGISLNGGVPRIVQCR